MLIISKWLVKFLYDKVFFLFKKVSPKWDITPGEITNKEVKGEMEFEVLGNNFLFIFQIVIYQVKIDFKYLTLSTQLYHSFSKWAILRNIKLKGKKVNSKIVLLAVSYKWV